MLNEVNGNYIKEKFGLEDGIKLKEKLHQQRVEWLKKLYNY